MSPLTTSRLPRRVLFTLVGLTVVGLSAGMTYSVSSGWNPPRAWSAFILPFYFAGLLGVLTLSFVISGNTLMHHFRTGTVQRDTSPPWFWSIVAVQSIITALLFLIGYINWRSLRG